MGSKLWLAILALVSLLVSPPVQATLGEDVSSVQTDQARMAATLTITNTVKFAVHEIRLPTTTVVREYVSSAGMVFAVSWRGPFLPDLQQVLGRYFEQYAALVRARHAAPGERAAPQTDLVVQTGGHMRALFGRAYVPQMLPRGVLAEEIE